jgi:hypothetical protein
LDTSPTLHALQVLHRQLQLAHPAGGGGLLQADVLGDAVLHAFRAQRHQRAPDVDQRLGVEVRPRLRMALDLVQQHELQVPPFARDFRQVVALLPAVRAVPLAGVALGLVRRATVLARPRLERLRERLEDVGQVVVEACAG